MALGRARDRDGELVAELLADELDKLGGIVQIAVGTRPAEGQVAAQRQHMVDAVIKIGLQLGSDVFFRVADAGEMRHRLTLAVGPDLVEHFQVLAHVRAARAVGTGNVVGVQGIQLFQHAARAAKLFHTRVGLRRENLE